MSLTEFVKLEHVQYKFKTEFKPAFKDKVKSHRKSRKGDITTKENVGLHFEIFKDKTKLICDSYGRKKRISSIEDLIGFFTLSKYGKNLCWFYDASSNFGPIMKYLPKHQLENLTQFGKTEYYAYTIECKDNRSFKIAITKSNNSFKFDNLYPFFHSSLEDAALKYLNLQKTDSINHKKTNKNIKYWNKHYDNIENYCIENAKIIQNLANYYVENDIRNTLAFKKITNIPKTKNYSTVGTAFDYLFRFLIKAHNPTAITNPWVAHRSLELLEGKEKRKAGSIIKDAEERYSLFLKEKEMNDSLVTSALLLAKLDVVYRRGVTLDEIEMDVDSGDIIDLKNLISGVPKDLYLGKKICILNPTFGLASHLVGGADADLLLDNTLIDIKTTIDPKFSPLYYYQLMGYVLLHYLGLIYSNNIKEIDALGVYEEDDADIFDKKFLDTKIEKIGVYFSRFNYLSTIDLNDILPEGKVDWNLLEWFENEAHKEYQPVRIKKYFNKSVWRKLKFGKITVDEILYSDL